MSRILAFVFFLVLFVPSPLMSEEVVERKDTRRIFERLRDKIKREERRYATLKEGQERIRRSLKYVSEEYDAAAKERKKLAKVLNDLERESRKLSAQMERTSRSLSHQRTALNKRIVGIYKLYRRSSALDYVFRAHSVSDLLKRSHYLTVIAAHDRSYIDKLTNFVEELARQKGLLDQISKQQVQNFEQVKVLETRLKEKRFKKAVLLQDAQRKTESLSRTLSRLNSSADKLEKVMAGLMGGKRVIESVERELGSATRGSHSDLEVLATRGFPGKGLSALRGKLDLPVTGRLIQRFGRTKHQEFADILFVKGLEFSASVGSRVRAVEQGRVVFDQVLPGYGYVVILDHGDRYYTLYGRLAGALVQLGDTVERGQVLAVLGEADHRGRNFYFELRVRGKAVDPLAFFVTRPKFVSG